MVARLVTAVACSLALAVVVVSAGTARSPGSTAAGCVEIIGHDPPAPYYRQPIAGVAVPAPFLPNVGSSPSAAPFTFWTKAGIVIRAGNAVTVTVAPSVANRVRITWGGVTNTAIRFSPCRTGAKWNDYAGGFLARTPTACVPLFVSAGGRRAVVIFGLGRHCSK